MNIEDWIPCYEEIRDHFGYSYEKDQQAADILSQLIGNVAVPVEELKKGVEGKAAIIYGAGPSLVEDLKKTIETVTRAGCFKVSADGATSALLSQKMFPDLIVTDLDGRVEDIHLANSMGAVLAIHAHGDNMTQVQQYTKTFRGKLFGTTQVYPRKGVYNFGGFTDGDRAAFILEALCAKTIVLAGMNFGSTIGRFSKPELTRDTPAPRIKREKLKFGKRLLERLAAHSITKIYNVTQGGEEMLKIQQIGAGQLLKIL